MTEPNNNFDEATLLGTIDSYYQVDLINDDTDEDWYEFAIAQPGGANDIINTYALSGNINLAFYDGERNLISESSGITVSDSFSLQGLPAGTYFFQVSGAGNSYYEFDLLAEGDGYIEYDDYYEPNDSIDEAYNLGLVEYFSDDYLYSASGDPDWYQFEIGQTGGTYDQVYAYAYDGNLDLALYDGSQNLISDSLGTDYNDTISLEGLSAGTYFLQVAGNSSQYEFSISADGYDEELDEQIDPSIFDDTIVGSIDNDTLPGSVDNDSISGGDGDDILLPNFGEDKVEGDNGTDTLVIDYSNLPTAAVIWSNDDPSLSLDEDNGFSTLFVGNAYGIDTPVIKRLHSNQFPYPPHASISPDGTTVAWDRIIQQIDGDSEPIDITYIVDDSQQINNVSLSDDGNQIAFTYNGGGQLYVSNIDGTDLIEIANREQELQALAEIYGDEAVASANLGGFFTKPVISGDGSKVFWRLSHFEYGNEEIGSAIGIANTDGTGEIYRHIPSDDFISDTAANLAISADGSKIAWIEELEPTGSVALVANSDFSDIKQISITSTDGLNNADVGSLSLSADGSLIAWSQSVEGGGGREFRIFTASTDSDDPEILEIVDGIKPDTTFFPISLSPDGDLVSYVDKLFDGGSDESNYGLFVTNVDGTGEPILITTGGFQQLDTHSQGLSSYMDIGVRYGNFDAATGSGEIITWGSSHVDFDSIERFDFTGTTYDDELLGGNLNDTLKGAGGADTLKGGQGNDIYELDVETAAGSQISDTDGDEDRLELITVIDTEVDIQSDLNFESEIPTEQISTLSLAQPTADIVGITKADTTLIVDLNRDGDANSEDDLSILNYFDEAGTGAGAGYIEEVANLSGADIINFLANGIEPPVYNDSDYYEPNDSLDEAYNLGLVDYFYDWVSLPPGSEDWYQFEIGQTGGTYDQVYSYSYGIDGVDLALYDEEQNLIRESGVIDYYDEYYYDDYYYYYDDYYSQISLTGLDAGTYYLGVSGGDGSDYEFGITADGYIYYDDYYDPNESIDEAYDLGLVSYFYDYASLERSPQDWYQFELGQTGGTYDEIYTYGYDLDVALYDAEQHLIAESFTADDYYGNISLEGLSAGTYYFEVTGNSGSYYDFGITADGYVEYEDYYEPNDSIEEAYDLGYVYYHYDYATVNPEQPDWYKFTLDYPGGTYDYINTYFSDSEGDIDIALYDAEQNLIDSSVGVSDSEYISLEGLSSGDYYLEVFRSDSGGSSEYNFEIYADGYYVEYYDPYYDYDYYDYYDEYDPYFYDEYYYDSYEPNDSASEASILGSIALEHGGNFLSSYAEIEFSDEDWYSFTLDNTGGFYDQISAYFSSIDGNIDLALYDADLNEIANSTGFGDEEYISLEGFNPGDYYLQVYGADGEYNPYYSLEISTTESYYSNDVNEPNEDFAGATNLGLVYSHYDFGSIEPANDQDWYRFEIAQAGGVWDEIAVWYDDLAGDVGITLYDAEQNLIDESVGTSGYEFLSLDGLAAGEYYLQVNGVGQATNPYYDFSIYAYGDDYYYPEEDYYQEDYYEPNNTASEASELGLAYCYYGYGVIEAGDTEDWYYFNTNTTGGAADGINVSFEEGVNIDITLYDANLNEIASSNGDDDWEFISLEDVAAGNYYVQVSGIDNDTDANYDFFINAYGVNDYFIEEENDDFGDYNEPNNTSDTATRLGPIDYYYGEYGLSLGEIRDRDWYRFSLAQDGGTYDGATVFFYNEEGNVDLALYSVDDPANPIAVSDSANDYEEVSFAGLPAGQYFLEVYGAGGGTNPYYDLDIYADGYIYEDDFYDDYTYEELVSYSDFNEPNNELDVATNLGTSDYYYTSGSISPEGDYDWYHFDLRQDGGFGDLIDVYFDGVEGDIDIALYDADGNYLDGSAGTSDYEYIDLEGYSAGTYYLEVYNYSGTSNSWYDVSIFAYGEVDYDDPYYYEEYFYDDYYDDYDPIYDYDYVYEDFYLDDYFYGDDFYDDNYNDYIANAPDDRFEDNDEMATAANLNLNAQTEWGDLIVNMADADWYRFNLSGEGKPGDEVSIDFLHANGDLDMVLHDAEGNWIDGSYGVQDGETIDLEGLPAGDYYLDVYGYAGASNDYSLSVVARGGDALEENDTFADAKELIVTDTRSSWTELSIESGDDDWYNFTLPNLPTAGDEISIEFDHELGDLDIALYDSRNRIIAASTGTSNSETISLEGLELNTESVYYLEVYGYAGASNPEYDLNIEIFPEQDSGITSDRFEENDASSEATLLEFPSGDKTWENLSIEPEDADWYRFNLPQEGTDSNEVSIDFAHDAGDLDLALYSVDDPEYALYYSAGTDDSETISLNALPAGDYYLEVYGYDGAINDDYSLSINVVPEEIQGDDYEGNNFFEEAADITPKIGEYLEGLNITAGDTDWYEFVLTQTGEAGQGIILDFAHLEGDLDVELYDANNEYVDGSYGIVDGEFINLEGVEPGNYFVQVYGYNGATNDYNMLIDAPGLTGESDRDDDYEDNDSRETAYELGLLEGNDPARNSFENLAIASNDPDWFEFAISQTGSDEHHVSIDFNHDAGDLDLALYDAQGNLLDISDSVSDGETITLYDRPAGRYYVEVYGFDGASNASYDLTFDTPEDIQSSFRDDESEPNDTFDTATVITEKLGQSIEDLIIVEDNQDWFTFELPGDAQPGDYVQLDFNGNAADLDLELYDSAGLLLRDSAGISDTENISLEGLSAGEYAVKVFNYEYQFADQPDYEPFGDAVAEYTLEVQAAPPDASQNIVGDIYEPNNDLANAFDLRTIIGTFSTEVPLSIHEERNADWFKFQSETDGLVSVSVDFEHDLGDIDLQVYQLEEDGSRTVVGRSETTDDTEMVIIPEAIPGEDYYIEVYGYAGDTNPEYNLTIDTPVIAEVEEEDKPEEIADDGIDDWTVMVYINADNRLDARGLEDINEMEAVMNLPDNVNVVVQIDRSGEYSDDWTDTRRGAITPDNNPYEVTSQLESIGEVNMGDASSLTEFINWGKANYTAENYSVVIWDHGGGLDGVSWDETNSYDYLTVDDVTQAISAAELGDSLGMVGFDACLMALAEVGYDLSGLTDVVVSSQQTSPGDGWDYTSWLEQIADTNGYINPEDLAQAVVDSYDEFYDGTYTQSAVRTSEYEDLKTEIDNFARTVLNNATDTDWQGIVAARNAASEHDWQLPGERDLRSFMQNIANDDEIAPAIQNAASEVIAQIDNVVIAQVDGLGYGGIGIYLPTANSYVRGDYNQGQFGFLADNAWDDFVFGLANQNHLNTIYADPTETSNSTDGIRSANFADSSSSPYQLEQLNIDFTLENLSIDNEQDIDWFEFNLPVDGTAEASVGINFAHAQGDLTLELFRKGDAQNAIATSATSDNNENISLDAQPAGDYLIKVSGQVNPEYELVLDAPELTEIPEDSQEATESGDETNDTFAKATDIGAIARNDELVLTGLTMDANDVPETLVNITSDTNASNIPAGGDWFVFNAVRNTALSPNAVTLLSEESGNLDLHLFDGSGNLIGSAADADRNTESVSFGEQSGEIYAYVTGATNAAYELNIARREFDINGDGVADTKDMLLTSLADSSFADSDIEGFIQQFDLTPAGSVRTTVDEIKDYVATALNNILDVNGDGVADTKDMLLTFLADSSFADSDIEGFIQQFGLITENSERDDIEAIREFINNFQPEPSESISTQPQIDPSPSLYGTDDADVITGTDADDTLIGGAGNDELTGKAGNDVFYGGTDNDILIGGAGADVFHVGLDSGNDVIEFEAVDTIVLDSGLGFSNFEELSSAISPIDSGSELVFNADNKLTINHTEDLTADNFDFL